MNRQITILQKLGEGTEYTIRQLAVLCETSYKMMQDRAMGFERSSGKEEMSDPDNYSEWKKG